MILLKINIFGKEGRKERIIDLLFMFIILINDKLNKLY